MLKKIFIPLVYFFVLFMSQGYGQTPFPCLDKWNKPGKVHTYNTDNLFEIINGAAVLYIGYDFVKLYRGDYTEKKDTNNYITLQVYQHDTPYDAFGIYSSERPMNATANSIGAEGYTHGSLLSFYKGPYYVIITSHDKTESTRNAIFELGKKTADLLEGTDDPPGIISFFPEKGLIQHSIQYANKQFLGYDLLYNAFVADYKKDGSSFKVFIIPNDTPETCKNMLTAYAERTGTALKTITEGKHLIADEYNGEVAMYWKDNYLYGFYNLDDNKTGDALIRKLEQNMGISPPANHE